MEYLVYRAAQWQLTGCYAGVFYMQPAWQSLLVVSVPSWLVIQLDSRII